MGSDAAAATTSAAEAIERTALQPLARRGPRCVASRAPTPSNSTGSRRRGSRAPSCARAQVEAERRSMRLADGNDALAIALAAELGDRLRLSCPRAARPGRARTSRSWSPATSERYRPRRPGAPAAASALTLVPALRERASYARLVFGSREQAARAARRSRSARSRAGARGRLLDVDGERRRRRARDDRVLVRRWRARPTRPWRSPPVRERWRAAVAGAAARARADRRAPC